jgi:hypothetical protein
VQQLLQDGFSEEAEPIVLMLEPYAGRLRQLQAQIGTDSHPLLFDTGGELTLIDPEIAPLVDCEPYGRLTGFRMSGERVDFQQCGQVQLQFGALTIERDVGVFELMALLPEGWPPLRGVLSLHTFQDRAITLDLANNQLVLETEQSLRDRVQDMHELRMHIERGVEGRGFNVYLEASALKGSIRLLLDSGNLAGFILAPHSMEQLGIDFRDKYPQTNGASEDATHEVSLDIVGLGPVTTPILIRDITHDGVISAEFMEKLVLTMDFKSNRVWGRIRQSE